MNEPLYDPQAPRTVWRLTFVPLQGLTGGNVRARTVYMLAANQDEANSSSRYYRKSHERLDSAVDTGRPEAKLPANSAFREARY